MTNVKQTLLEGSIGREAKVTFKTGSTKVKGKVSKQDETFYITEQGTNATTPIILEEVQSVQRLN